MTATDDDAFEIQADRVYGDDFCPAGGGWIDRVLVDQWWAVSIQCEHGRFKGTSNGITDLGVAIRRAIERGHEAHEQQEPQHSGKQSGRTSMEVVSDDVLTSADPCPPWGTVLRGVHGCVGEVSKDGRLYLTASPIAFRWGDHTGPFTVLYVPESKEKE